MDNRDNSRANTCAQTRLLGRVVFISYKTNPGSAWSCGDFHRPHIWRFLMESMLPVLPALLSNTDVFACAGNLPLTQ